MTTNGSPSQGPDPPVHESGDGKAELDEELYHTFLKMRDLLEEYAPTPDSMPEKKETLVRERRRSFLSGVRR